MARDIGQQFIFSDDELSLIKNTFADNDALLYTVRKVLLQFPLTDAEKNLIKLSITPEVLRVLKKRILPEPSDEFPLGQLPSLLTTLTEQLKVKNVEEMASQFAAKKIEIDYLEQQFAILADVDGQNEVTIMLHDLAKLNKTPDAQYVHITAYLFILGYVDPMLTFVKSIAGTKKETIEDLKKRMTRDSSK